MATKFTGRQFNLGVAKEAVRGTALAAQYWLPYNTLTIDDEIKVVKDEAVYGVIESGVGQKTVLYESKGSVDGNITDKGFGALLMATFGTDTIGAVETGVKDHVFTVAQNAQHPSLTFSVVEPNSNAGAGFAYPLSMIEDLTMDFEVGKYATYKATFMGNKGANLANTTAYTAENHFHPQDGIFKLATNLAGLAGASSIAIQKASVNIKKNTEPDEVIGNTSPVDRLNKNFAVSGSIELKYSDRSMIDTYLLADLQQAMSLSFVNSGVTIGSASNPTLTVRLAAVKFENVARKVDPKGIVIQTVKFNAYYSIADSKMIDLTLRNTVVTAY